MAVSMFSCLLISSLVLLLYGVLRVSYSIWWKPKWLEKRLRQQGIRGTPYKLVMGDMKEYIRLITEAWSKPMNLNHHIVSRVDPFTQNNMQQYGKVSLFWAGTTPRLIVMDPGMIKEVLRIINPAFHLEKLKVMIPAFTTSCSMLIERWKELASLQETCEVDIWPELQNLTRDVISRAALGSSFEEGRQIFELQKEHITLTLEAMQTLYIPGFRFIPTKKNQRRKYLQKRTTSMFRDLIQRKKDAIRTGQAEGDNLLGLLLLSNNAITLEEVIEECKQFYLAGHETTSSWLTWTVTVLAMHPNWQEKAREEVMQICGKKEPDSEALSHLKIVSMILYEVLRLYPPVIAVYQHAYKETKIGTISLPAGVDLTLPTLLIHHDPELWGDDAEEFKPERFAEGVSKASKDQLAFFPFGWGPRTCIGQNFAMIEAKVALAMILQHFSFELSPSYTHAPHTVMTLQPQHGAQLKFYQL
ncbi:unnamed protein product, partial [Vitis vinifera]